MQEIYPIGEPEATFDLQEFQNLLKNICTIDPKLKILHFFIDEKDKSNIYSEFLLIKSTEQKIREDDFIRVLIGAIVRFSLPFIRWHSPSGLSQKEIDSFYEQNILDLAMDAKDLFIEKISKSTSEFGELFLFMLMESKGFVQLLNKMNLKTNADMPVHGLDAIHVGVVNDSLVFNYGYSKVYEAHTDAIRDAVKEINTFSKSEKRQKREYDLVKAYIDKDKFGAFTDKIVNIISPYAEDQHIVADVHSVFLGYHWPLLDDPKLPSTKLDDYLVKEYLKTVEQMQNSIKDHINDLPNYSKTSFTVWTLPLTSLDKFRAKFMDKLKPV